MQTKYTGGCLCGEIRYAADVEPVFSGNCHCTDCQRSSGGAFIPAMMFPQAAVSVSGAPKYFKSKADSGRDIERGFCPNCGSQLFTRLALMPGFIGIKAGTLDEPSRYVPVMDFHVASAQPWDAMNPALPKRRKSPREQDN